jgi:ATP-dependent Zn protease
MRTESKRLCIYPKDIQRITGKSYRQSIRLLQKMRKKLNKLEDELVSIEEFCQFTSLKIEQVEPFIVG